MVALASAGQGRERRARNALRTASFAGLAGFVLLGPAAPQMLDVHSILLRPWIMYSGVGVGILKGQFRLADAEGGRATMSPLELLGRSSYPVQFHYEFDRLVIADRDLGRFAAEYCQALPEGALLSFDGSVGSRAGWRPLAVADVCREDTASAAATLRPRAALAGARD